MPKSLINRVGKNQKSNFMKKYVKAEVVAINSPQGSYAAGCPEKNVGGNSSGTYSCKGCERTR